MQKFARLRSKSQHTISLSSTKIGNSPIFLSLLLLTGFSLAAISILLGLTKLDDRALPHTVGTRFFNEDAEIWQQAFKLSDQGQYAQAFDVSEKARSQVLAPVLQWREMISGRSVASLKQINRFMDTYSHFPSIKLVEIARQSLSAPRLSNTEMLDYYNENPPINFAAELHHLKIMADEGQKDAAIDAAREIWRHQTLLPAEQENLFRAFGQHFKESDHLRRLDHLITHGARHSGRRLLPYLPEDWQQFVTAWSERTDTVSVPFRMHPVFAISKVFEADERGDIDKAIGILDSIPHSMRLPEYEWRARHIITRELIKEQRFDEAYRMALNHGLLAVDGKGSDTVAEANWLAGWVALTRMGLTFSAQQSFELSLASAESANWKAQSAYWLAMTFLTQRQQARADALFEQCASLPHTYYGQLCLSRKSQPLFSSGLPLGKKHFDKAQFSGGEHQQLIKIAQELADFDLRSDAAKFLNKLSKLAKSPDDIATLADIGKQANLDRTTLNFAWSAADRGLIELSAMLPIVEANLVAPIDLEMSLLHAIASRESVFKVNAVSPKGALGLMQVMPNTAKHTAQRLGLEWSEERMLNDPGYNFTIGGAFLAEMVKRYEGNLLLAITAYNAGTGNVDRWVDDFGDPSAAGIDAEIWLESIPFRNTRHYVKDIIARYNLYRALFSKKTISIFTSNYLSGT